MARLSPLSARAFIFARSRDTKAVSVPEKKLSQIIQKRIINIPARNSSTIFILHVCLIHDFTEQFFKDIFHGNNTCCFFIPVFYYSYMDFVFLSSKKTDRALLSAYTRAGFRISERMEKSGFLGLIRRRSFAWIKPIMLSTVLL